jgi:hypothetical protein
MSKVLAQKANFDGIKIIKNIKNNKKNTVPRSSRRRLTLTVCVCVCVCVCVRRSGLLQRGDGQRHV